MPIEDQVAVIYCGVRGFLDKIDPARITEFEKQFLEHIKGTQQRLLGSLDMFQELLLKLGDPGWVNFVKEASDTAVDDRDLILNGHWDILTLLKLGKSHTTVKELLCGCV